MKSLLATASLLAGALCHAGVVTERWGVAGRAQHQGTIAFEPQAEGGRLLRLDLSALPKDTKVYRARLFFSRPGRYGTGFDIVAVQPPLPRGEGRGEGAPPPQGKEKLKPFGRPLQLAAPHWRWFDATEAVREWVKKEAKPGLLLLRKAPQHDEKASYLEIAYEGQPNSAMPPQATEVKAFYRSGQVFVTFKEVEGFAGGKEEITWGELADRFRGIDYEGPLPNDLKSEIRYRIYAHSKPITAETLGEAQLVGEAVPGSIYNTRLVPDGDFIAQRPKAVALRLAVEPAKPLPPGYGLFVHTVAHHGNWHYAVVTCINGIENTVELSEKNVAGPIEQRPAPPEPVLQRDVVTDLRDGRSYHEQWYSYWAVPPQAPRPTRYDLAVGFCPDSMTRPTPLEFTRGHTWGNKPEMPGPEPRRGIFMSMSDDPENGFWTGINDARDTLKGIEEGAWKPFAHNRQEALIRWAQKKWEIDPQRIVSGIGAWGMWELKRADLYAYIHGWGMPEITKGFQCWDWARGVWGQPDAYKGKPDDENPFYLQDYTRWVLANPDKELPFFHIHTGWGMHSTEMGWPPFPRFVRAMMDTRRAFAMHSAALGEAMRQGIIELRRDQSVPAFANCSLDDNIGEGDLLSGEPFGQINAYLVWESATIVDEPGLYAITLWLWGGDPHGRGAAPLDSCTVDLTPRRCRRFKPKPGDAFAWANIALSDGKEVQSGRLVAADHGLVTLERLAVTKARHRITIRRAE